MTARGIVYVSRDAEIRMFEFATGATRTLLKLPRSAGFGLSVSPVDGSILYTLLDQESTEIDLVENFR